jgi:hypothetical protein
MTKSSQIDVTACSARRCLEGPVAMVGELCGRVEGGQPTNHGCGQWFCIRHLGHVLTLDGEVIRLCARCERAWNRARLAEWDQAMREMGRAAVDPRTVYAILVAMRLLLPVIATWPSPAALVMPAVLTVVTIRYGP